MEDISLQIPALAFISKQIIQEAEKAGVLNHPTKTVMANYGIHEAGVTIRNMSQVLGLLYCLIVVPRELWLRKESHELFDQVDEKWLLSLVSIEIKDNKFDSNPCCNLLKHLRNAISHVRFSISKDEDFIFWDQKNELGPENFRAIFTVTNLEQFISKVGAILANYGLEQRRKQYS